MLFFPLSSIEFLLVQTNRIMASFYEDCTPQRRRILTHLCTACADEMETHFWLMRDLHSNWIDAVMHGLHFQVPEEGCLKGVSEKGRYLDRRNPSKSLGKGSLRRGDSLDSPSLMCLRKGTS